MGVQTLQSWESLICLDMGEIRMNSEGKKTRGNKSLSGEHEKYRK